MTPNPTQQPQRINLPIVTIADKSFNLLSIIGIDWQLFPPFFGFEPARAGTIAEEGADEVITVDNMTVKLDLAHGVIYEFIGTAGMEFFLWYLSVMGQNRIESVPPGTALAH